MINFVQIYSDKKGHLSKRKVFIQIYRKKEVIVTKKDIVGVEYLF